MEKAKAQNWAVEPQGKDCDISLTGDIMIETALGRSKIWTKHIAVIK
jgi:hypothetical protein